jgi:hypothetical protein
MAPGANRTFRRERHHVDGERVEATLDAPAAVADPQPDGRAVVFLLVFVPLVLAYSLTAQWRLPYHIDAMTNAITGWYVGNEGTVIADRHDALTEPDAYAHLGWFVESPRGTVGQYPPGAALVAGSFYAVAPGGLTDRQLGGENKAGVEPVTVGVPPLWPATLSAVLATAGAAAVLALTFLGLGADRRTAVLGGLAFGLATGAWSIAAAASWTHGPAMLAVALALLAAQRDRWALSGAAFAFAILARPHLAVIAAAVGVGVAWHRRQLRPAAALGLSASVGLAALLAYNTYLWGEPSVSGGYGDGFEEQFAHSGLGWFVANVWHGLVDPQHGLLPWAPFVALLAVAAVAARRHQVDWTLAAAVGGVLYLLIQWRANSFAGGKGHSGYRYPLEMLVACAPAFFVGYQRWVAPRPVAMKLLVVGLTIGFAGQLTASVAS